MIGARTRPPRPGNGRLQRVVGPLALAALLLGVALPAEAQEPARTGLTIYSQNLALVRVEVDRPVTAGEQTVRVDGLPSNLRASSLLVLDEGVTLLGVHGRRSYQSAGEGGAVSLALDLRVDRPLEALRLAFLTGGMGWNASYSMLVDRDDGSARIDGYATIANNSGTRWEDAAVQLMAGTVNVDGGGGRRGAREMAMVARAAADQAPSLSREAFSGYHLYDVDVPLTLATGSRHRVRLMGADRVPVTREYVLPGEISYYQQMSEPRRQEAVIRYRVRRPEGTSFADLPLPAGTVRVFQRDDQGRVQLLGADGIPNSPAREELVLTVGRAFDIGGTRTQTDFRRPEGDVRESDWEVELVNRTDADVTVQVLERIDGDWEILESSHEPRQLSAHRVRFDVPVPAGGEATLTYRVRVEN